jgi:predicted ATP-grasp superfamily ATP-dependent carboligase
LLASRAIPTYVVGAPRGDMIASSRWYRPAPRQIDETSDSARLAEYLDALPLERAVLLPCTDAWTRAVAGLPPELRERYPASVPARPVVEDFVDKDRFRALMTRLDLARPRCVTLNDVGDLAGVSDSEIESGFLKPTDSQLFSSRFEGKGFWARDRDEAGRLIVEARAAGVELMLQEWVPGDPSHNVLIDCFVDRHGKIAGLLARRKIRREPPLLGNTASAVTIPLSEVAEPVAAVRTIIKALGHRGVFSAEFKYDARDGQFKILEVNARLFWYVTHTAAAGIDLAWMSYLDALEFPVPLVSAYRTGIFGIYEINDAVALKRSWQGGRRQVGPVMRPWLIGHRALFWWSDPGPALMELQADLRRRLASRRR